MEDRVKAMEAALTQAIADIAEAKNEAAQATTRAVAAEAAVAAAAPVGGGGAPSGSGASRSGFGVDTRMLGRPDVFQGDESKWADWSTVLRAYGGICNSELLKAMPLAEAEAGDVSNAAVSKPEVVTASNQLYFMLVLITRNEPLNIVVNAGSGEGLLAWRRLVDRYEGSSATRLASIC